jgi:hypothetical protein
MEVWEYNHWLAYLLEEQEIQQGQMKKMNNR